jgi:hypothetical protein
MERRRELTMHLSTANYDHTPFYAHAQTRSLLLLLVAEPRTCKQRRPVLGSATLFPHCKQKLVESGLNT